MLLRYLTFPTTVLLIAYAVPQLDLIADQHPWVYLSAAPAIVRFFVSVFFFYPGFMVVKYGCQPSFGHPKGVVIVALGTAMVMYGVLIFRSLF